MIAIIDYDAGNLRSVQKAFEAIGQNACITTDKKIIKNASHVVLPGVGAFQCGINELNKLELVDTIKDVAKSGKPFLGICLGMQMLFSKSYEGGVFDGMNIIQGEVKKFEVSYKIPHMGWNNISFKQDAIFDGIKNKSSVYFVHSYYCAPSSGNDVLATCDYGGDFCCAIKKDNIYGFQFHPEKSGEIGLKLIKNFAKLKV